MGGVGAVCGEAEEHDPSWAVVREVQMISLETAMDPAGTQCSCDTSGRSDRFRRGQGSGPRLRPPGEMRAWRVRLRPE